jgi:hypothetical protein
LKDAVIVLVTSKNSQLSFAQPNKLLPPAGEDRKSGDYVMAKKPMLARILS